MFNFEWNSQEKKEKGLKQIIPILLNFFNKTENTNRGGCNDSQSTSSDSPTGNSNSWLEEETNRICKKEEEVKNLEEINKEINKEILSSLKKIKDDINKDLKNILSSKQENLITDNIVPFKRKKQQQ